MVQVVDVDNVRQRVTVKLIPRVDLQMIANKLVSLSLPYSPSNFFRQLTSKFVDLVAKCLFCCFGYCKRLMSIVFCYVGFSIKNNKDIVNELMCYC